MTMHYTNLLFIYLYTDIFTSFYGFVQLFQLLLGYYK